MRRRHLAPLLLGFACTEAEPEPPPVEPLPPRVVAVPEASPRDEPRVPPPANVPGPSRAYTCWKGDCDVVCPEGTHCRATCSGGDCEHVCEAGAECSFSCTGGDCAQHCESGSSCRLTCSGGGCNRTCDRGASCWTTCSGRDCAG